MSQPISEMKDPLRARRVLVAGGDGEIGSAISASLAADGADVAIASIAGNSANDLASRLADGKNRTAGYEADVTDSRSVAELVESITTAWGGIDVLVNCVGILKVSSAEDFDAADWREVIETNLVGAFLLSQAVGRVMIKNGDGGRMVHLSSVRGAVGLSVGGFTAYGASKAGLHLLIKQLAAEWGKHQISVNGVAAGFVRTRLSAKALETDDFQKLVAARTPLGRVAEIQDVANAAVYLAGPRSGFVTGQVLFVDGGLTATQ
ncbi:MAG TPA: SDR family oxidoreductase [Mycobacteriales bacterium]|nr:SDR family oxidoreductase [Mycobacteriales bacterium]